MRISSRIFTGYAIILALFGVVTFINFSFSGRVNDNMNYLVRSETIIRNSAQLQRYIIDMENAFRGYLLTGRESFLEPYHKNAATVPQLFDELQAVTPDTSFQTKTLDTLENLYQQWRDDFAEKMITKKRASLTSSSAVFQYDKLYGSDIGEKVGKNITDLIRNKFKQFNDYEYHYRQVARERLNTSIVNTNRISIALIIISVVLGLVSTVVTTQIISKRISQMVEAAEKIAQGFLKTRIENTGTDELASLSDSLNQMAIRLEENFTDLERKNTDLNQFAYIVSHDLKAPLRGIQNVFQWINEDFGDRLDPQILEYHTMIKGRIMRLEHLIQGILEISRIGRSKRPVEQVDVGELLQEVLENLSPPHGMKVHIPEQLPLLITEKVLLYQVFTNLVSNAIKYHHTKQGNVYIHWQEQDKFHEFEVADDGPGIEPEYHEKIFQIFQTLQERDAFESTGVGLAIVKKIVDEKGGKIWIRSAPEKGAAFIFSWPKFGEVGA